MSFESFECDHCGDAFEASDDAQAAQTGYCSHRCETAGKGLG